MIGIYVIEILATFIEILIGILINIELLSQREKKVKEIIYITVGIVVLVWIMNQYKLFSIFTTVIAIIGIVMGTYIISRINILDSFILTILYMVLVYILDFCSLTIFVLIYQEDKWAQIISSTVSLERLYPLSFSKLFLIGVSYWLTKKCLCKIEVSIRKMWIGVILSCFCLYYLIKGTYLAIDANILMAWVFFLAVVLLAIYSMVQYIYYTQEKNQFTLALERNSIQLDAYNQLIQNYQEKQIFYHDLKNQYLVVGNYIKNREYDKAEEYMEQLKNVGAESFCKSRTGMQAVDILLDYKIKEAQKQHIQVDTKIDTICLPISEQELISLLGNAIDNAIEACNKMSSNTKWIRITIQKVQEMTMIKIVNSYEHKPIEKSGRFISSKSNPQLHGLGIRSMKGIVEKYEGKLKIEYAEGEFSLVILFFH